MSPEDAERPGALASTIASPWRLEGVGASVRGARMPSLSDAELFRAGADDTTAFETVFLRHVSAVHRYLAARVEPAIVEDLVSETFVLAYVQRGRYRPEYPNARPWLLGIATNLLRHHHRSERARLHAYRRLNELEAEGADATALAADARTVRGTLVDALRQLRREDRDSLLLFVWGQLSYEEIAHALQIPVGTVRSRINRARSCLRRVLEPDERLWQ